MFLPYAGVLIMSKYITIDGFESLTKQQMFDISAKHILSTGKCSLNSAGTCSYAGSGCAAAPFIKPEYRKEADTYNTNDAGTSWGDLVKGGYAPEHEQKFVTELQLSHDSHASAYAPQFLDNYRYDMKYLGKEHGLDISVLGPFDEQQTV